MKFFIISLLSCAGLCAQEAVLLEKLPLGASTFIATDAYNSTYYTKNGVLYKQGGQGSFQFNDFTLGAVTSVDVINPLNIVVFYQGANTVVLLDNRLSEIERFSFNSLPEIVNVGTATNAGNNRLWIFNIDTQQLERYDYRTRKRTPLSQPFTGAPTAVASNFNYAAIATENKISLLNIYGALVFETAANGFEQLFLQHENVYGTKQNELFFIVNSTRPNERTASKRIKIPLPEITLERLFFAQDLLYIYDGNTRYTFLLKQPKK